MLEFQQYSYLTKTRQKTRSNGRNSTLTEVNLGKDKDIGKNSTYRCNSSLSSYLSLSGVEPRLETPSLESSSPGRSRLRPYLVSGRTRLKW